MKSSNQQSLERDLGKRIRGDIYFDELSLGLYSTDASIYQIRPKAVVVPRDDADVICAVEVAAQHGVSILPRGAGTSLGGQAVGESVVIDFTKWMNQILELNIDERWIRVQPGLVRDNLNAYLAPHRLHFAPDPATSSRATIGGMIGNNSCGTRSVVYGKTSDHVLETRVLLSDGEIAEFKALSSSDYAQRLNKGDRIGNLLKVFQEKINSNAPEIEKKFPKVMRRVCGYALDSFINTDSWNLSNLITGSEGTLGTILDTKINLEPLPEHTSLCVVHFADLLESIRAVQSILPHSPSAVEILDRTVLEMGCANLSIAPLCSFLEGSPETILIVEFFGESDQDAIAKAENMASDLQSKSLGYAYPIFRDSPAQQRIWSLRHNSLGLMLGLKGERKPLPFIEDVCVPTDVLPEYIDEVLKICKDLDVDVAMYAHISVGTIHVRPILDLKQQGDIEKLTAITEQCFQLVVKYGGAWSGEHGDGRVRSPFLKDFFGEQIYGLFKDVKVLFDPDNLMNPGVIVDPAPMDQDLRYGSDYKRTDFSTLYHYREDGSFAAAVEMCTGVGACRQTLAGTMCPSYRATRDEQHSTRGRANALRLAMTGQSGSNAMTDQALFDVLDLCLSCKSCKSECPSNVDMTKLKSEFLRKYHAEHGIGLRDRLLCKSTGMAALICGPLAPIVNAIQRSFLFRKALEIAAGIDSRRCLPEYASQSFRKWFAKRGKAVGGNGNDGNDRSNAKKVVLFEDTYMNFFEPNVGHSAVELLESCGYEVILAEAGCCQRPRISHGFLEVAKLEGERTLRALDAFIKRGLQIVVCEPGCASALTDDLPDLIDDEELAARIADNVMMIDVFLHREIEAGRLDCGFTSHLEKILIHGHCHQKSLYGTTAMKAILDRVPGITATEIDSGCCGMAGSFGYEKEHYDLSLQIGEETLFPAIRTRPKGTSIIACGFSCRHQIAHATGTKALHWVETIRGQRRKK